LEIVKKIFSNLWFKIFVTTFSISLIIFLSLFYYLFSLSKTLPSIEELNKFNPEQVTKIISADDVVLKKLFILTQ